jgi:Na+-driven multidrug efflux pump
MLRLASPVVVIQLGMMSMGVVDTVMVGHLSTQALAAVALGNLYFFCFAVFGMGTLMVLDPIVAQAVAGGILRGLGQTRVAMTGNLLGYWAIGLPVSYYLCFVAGWGPVGLWWGLVLGLGLVAGFLLTRVRLGLGRQ